MHIINKKTYKFLLVIILVIGLYIINQKTVNANELFKDYNQTSEYARQSLKDLFDKGVIVGDEDNYYKPKRSVTRGEMITLIVRALELDISNLPTNPTFEDVQPNHWAYPYIETAYREGVTAGISSTLFGIDDVCTREQMASMFVKALGMTSAEIGEKLNKVIVNSFSDIYNVSHWAKDYVIYAYYTGIIKGTSAVTLQPKMTANREQAAVLTHRFITKNDKAHMTLEEIAKKRESIVLIQTFDKNNELMMQGTGFFIDTGLILTNFHVLEGSSRYEIVTDDGLTHAIEGIVKYSEEFDMALIKTLEPVEYKPLEINYSYVGNHNSQVIAIGNPEGIQNVVSDGVIKGREIMQYQDEPQYYLIENTANTTYGSSGGPLLNNLGQVIGITTYVTEDSNINYAINIFGFQEWVEEFKDISFQNMKVIDMTEIIEEFLYYSDEDIIAIIYKQLSSIKDKDIDKYLSYFHKLAEIKGYKSYLRSFLSNFNMKYYVNDIKIINYEYFNYEVDITYTAVIDRYEPIKQKIKYYLKKYKGEWKIINAKMIDINIEDDEIYDSIIHTLPDSLQVTDSISHPTKPIIYISDIINKKVYAYNYRLNNITEIELELPPERLAYANGELFVTLLKRNHDSYWWVDEQEGAIAIIDSDTFTLKKQFNINLDPYDIIVGRDNYIYVASGSGQWTEIKSYSRESLLETSTISIRQMSYIELHPTLNKIYTITTDLSPRDMQIYNINDGVFDPSYPNGLDSPFHGEFEMLKHFRLSPDGKYVFNSSGNVFNCIFDDKGTIDFYDKINMNFIDIAFNLENNKFYTGLGKGLIYEYNYLNFNTIDTFRVKGDIVNLYYDNDELIALTKINNEYYIEIIELDK